MDDTQTQLNGTKRDWSQQCRKRVLRTHERRMFRIGSAKLVCRLNTEFTTFTAHRLFECERQSLREGEPARALVTYRRGCYGYRNVWQRNTCELWKGQQNQILQTLGRSKVEEFCAEIGQTESHAKTMDQKPKKHKQIKFAVEAMDTNDETVKNKLKDSRIAKIKNKSKDSRIAKIKNKSKDATLRWMHILDMNSAKLSRVWTMDKL